MSVEIGGLEVLVLIQTFRRNKHPESSGNFNQREESSEMTVKR